jgi:hypothetical protein
VRFVELKFIVIYLELRFNMGLKKLKFTVSLMELKFTFQFVILIFCAIITNDAADSSKCEFGNSGPTKEIRWMGYALY